MKKINLNQNYSKKNGQGTGGFKNESRGNHILKCVNVCLYTSTA